MANRRIRMAISARMWAPCLILLSVWPDSSGVTSGPGRSSSVMSTINASRSPESPCAAAAAAPPSPPSPPPNMHAGSFSFSSSSPSSSSSSFTSGDAVGEWGVEEGGKFESVGRRQLRDNFESLQANFRDLKWEARRLIADMWRREF